MKTIIIGNGNCITEKQNGHKIDKFDCVVRMGSCRVRGYEEYVGTKTDIYRTSWDRLISNKTRDFHQPYKAIPIRFTFKEILFLEPDPNTFFETTTFINDRFLNILHKKFFIDISFPPFLFKQCMQRIMHDSCLSYYKHLYQFEKCSYLNIVDRVKAFQAVNIRSSSSGIIIPSSGLMTIFHILRVRPNDIIFITGFDGFRTRYYWRDYETNFSGHCSFREQLVLKKLLKEKKIYAL